jgi:serine/threonine-protein kinase
MTERVGRYRLHGEIASGGMATVYLASLEGSVGFTRRVAVKRLHPQFAKDADFVAMFIDEARLASRIHHPNVVATLDALTENDELLLVMEYVHGETLSRLQRQNKGTPVPTPIAAAIMTGVLWGLQAAHEAKDDSGRALALVHRDVSPHNVLVGVDGVARIADFGIAKAETRIQTTREGQLKGKLGYMSPEQISSQPVDRRSDLFAASVVLWEMLTGKRLYAGADSGAVLMRIVSGEVIAPSAHNPSLPAAVDEIVLRGLARDPNVRFASAQAMAEAIAASMDVASPAEVGAWVAATAAERLAERASLLDSAKQEPHGVESTAAQATSPVVVPATGPAAPRSRWIIAALAAVAVASAAGAVFWANRPTPGVSELRTVGAALAESRRAADPPRAEPSALPAASASAGPAPVGPARPKPAPVRASPRAKPAARPNCTPPYTVGPDGVHKWKSECI